MPRNFSFWRNVGIIALVHAAALVGLARWSGGAKKAAPAEILWMSGGSLETAEAVQPIPAETPIPVLSSPVEQAAPNPIEPPAEPAIATPVNTQTEMTTPTPAATLKPTSTPPRKPSPKPKASASPKKTLLARAASPKPKSTATDKGEPTPSAKTTVASPKKTSVTVTAVAGTGSGHTAGDGSGPGGASQFGWYGSMLHDRFFKEWAQPTSVVVTGAKMSALVKIRIEQDGRVSEFSIVRSSGNVVVDESVAAVAKRVERVDPLPSGLGNGSFYEVKINFELNAE